MERKAVRWKIEYVLSPRKATIKMGTRLLHPNPKVSDSPYKEHFPSTINQSAMQTLAMSRNHLKMSVLYTEEN